MTTSSPSEIPLPLAREGLTPLRRLRCRRAAFRGISPALCSPRVSSNLRECALRHLRSTWRGPWSLSDAGVGGNPLRELRQKFRDFVGRHRFNEFFVDHHRRREAAGTKAFDL